MLVDRTKKVEVDVSVSVPTNILADGISVLVDWRKESQGRRMC